MSVCLYIVSTCKSSMHFRFAMAQTSDLPLTSKTRAFPVVLFHPSRCLTQNPEVILDAFMLARIHQLTFLLFLQNVFRIPLLSTTFGPRPCSKLPSSLLSCLWYPLTVSGVQLFPLYRLFSTEQPKVILKKLSRYFA